MTNQEVSPKETEVLESNFFNRLFDQTCRIRNLSHGALMLHLCIVIHKKKNNGSNYY